jgi:DNA end-binding protein Ku
MARAIWTGTIGFGLVQIPVALHGGEEADDIDLHLLDRRDFAPVGYQRINKKTGKEVPWDEIVKGHQHAPGKYVVLTDADLKAANVEATRSVDITDFVDFAAIDPRLIDRPYYLVPEKAGRKAYALLRETLKRTGKAGIGKIVIRTRQHLAAVVARDKALVLVVLRFASELRDEADLDLPETNLSKLGISSKEVAMAEQLVKSLDEPRFDSKKYVDEYRRDLHRLIASKVKAGEINQVPEETTEHREKPATNVIDLSSLLASSLKGGKPAAKNGAHKNGAHTASAHKSGAKKSERRGPKVKRASAQHGRGHHRKSA